MKLTDYKTGQKLEVPADIIIEMHSRGPYSEVKTVIAKYMVKESVPQIMELLRRESTS